MSGLVLFFILIATMLLLATGTRYQSRFVLKLSFFSTGISAAYSWYVFIFPEGLNLLFFIGTLVMVLSISYFFYAMYDVDLAENKSGQEC